MSRPTVSWSMSGAFGGGALPFQELRPGASFILFFQALPLILVVVGYSVSLFLLSLVVKTVPVGVAYAIWSGLGIVLVSIVALVVYQQKLDLPAIIGMGLIVAGVVFIQLFSKTAGH